VLLKRIALVSRGLVRVPVGMKLMRSAAAIGIARKIYTEARKPENQRRIKQAVASMQARRGKGSSGAGPRR
jgi:hypothetical protein